MNIQRLKGIDSWWVTGILVLILIALFWGYGQLAKPQHIPPIIESANYSGDPLSNFIYQAPTTLNYYLNEDAASFRMDSGFIGQFPPITLNFATWENDVEAEIIARHEDSDTKNHTLYDLSFSSEYQFSYGEIPTTTLEFLFPFPENLATLHDVHFVVNGEEPTDVQFTPQHIRWVTPVVSDDSFEIEVQYKASGVGQFVYALRQGLRADSLDATFVVEGASGSTITEGSLPTTTQEMIDGQDVFTWQYNDLIVDQNIELTLPVTQTIGEQTAVFQNELATLRQIAPLLVLLFLLTFALMLRMTNWKLGLPGYLILGVTSAWFYPLFTFLSYEIGLFRAGIISAGIVLALIILFLRMTLNTWRASLIITWPFLICIGALSLGMFASNSEVWLALGGTLLGGTLLMTYAKRPLTFESANITENETEAEIEESEPPTIYCPQCGRLQHEDYDYCPSCSFDNEQLQRCQHCYHEQIVYAEGENEGLIEFCLHCGEAWQATDWQFAI